MKTTLIALMACLFAAAPVAEAAKIKGDGNIVKREIAVSDFVELTLTGDLSCNSSNWSFGTQKSIIPLFHYSQSNEKAKLFIETDANLFDYLKIENKEGKLLIGSEKNKTLYPTKFVVTGNSSGLQKLSSSGCMDFELQSTLSGEELQVQVSGASDVRLNKAVRVEEVLIKTSGAGDLYANDLQCGKMEVTVTGSSDVKIKGKAAEARYRVSGSGDISAKEFIVEQLDCHVSGSGDIRCHATETLQARASGSGDIYYSGNPRADTKTSGAGDIHKSR